VRAPAIELTAPVDAVGVAADRQMRLPRDPGRLGWYRFGPAPDSGRGSAVLAGHVDSETYGVGPLARLGELRPGDTVDVRLATGRWRRFRVDSIQAFERRSLPDSVFSRSGPERLRLVTCAGAYLPDAGGYQENLVVTAVPAWITTG
jgi:sortase (surface protein transpeptidase)